MTWPQTLEITPPTEREKDERDLAILRDYEAGTPKAELMRDYGVTRHYIYKLIEEALDD